MRRCILAILCMSALPLYAQYTQTSGTTPTEKVTRRPMAKKPEAAQTSTAATTATAEQKAMPQKAARARRKASGSGVWNDVNRLSAILIDTQNEKVTIPDQAWRVTANEANSLANRIYAGTGGTKAARDLRTHVREMHSAAMNGDANSARAHAGMALPFAYQVIDATAPAM